jgi:hypothetical protein
MFEHIAKYWASPQRLLNEPRVFFVLLALVFATGGPAYGQSDRFAPETLLVAHELPDGSTAISQLSMHGELLQRFGALPAPAPGSSNEFRAHLALSRRFLFRSNGVQLNTISEFNPAGKLKNTITPNTSTQHNIVPIAQDFTNGSIYMVDTFAGSNVIQHLDDPSLGASSPFATLQYAGIAGITDLYFGGPHGKKALYALTQTSTAVVPDGKYRVAKIDSTGAVQFFDNPKLTVPFIFDVGSLAVAPMGGNIYVATTTEIVAMDASGAPLISFPFVDIKPSLDIDVNGNVYVGHFNSTTGQIDVFRPSGKLIRTLNVPGAIKIIDIVIVRPRRR